MQEIAFLLFVFIPPPAGFLFLRLKGYTSWWYLSIVLSWTPLFWLVFGMMRTRSESKLSKPVSWLVTVTAALVTVFLTYFRK